MIRLTIERKRRVGELHRIGMLPIQYVHVTNTVPQGLRALLRANQRDGYALLMEAPPEDRLKKSGAFTRNRAAALSWFNRQQGGTFPK